MTDTPLPSFYPPPTHPPLEPEACQSLLQCLRRKEQTWVEWAKACQQLQRSGYSAAQIFEETGLEPIQQNQIIVAQQVYESICKVEGDPAVPQHFGQRGSDILYELRGLTPPHRSLVANFVHQRQLDADQARELAKAYKDFVKRSKIPPGFTEQPGDAWAYQFWRWAQERSDLQERSRLIAQGFAVVQSDSARQALQDLLTQWTLPNPTVQAPHWPLYRLDAEQGSPRILPVAGTLPVSIADWEQTPTLPLEPGPVFQLYPLNASHTYVAVPGWEIIHAAQSPIALQACVADLPHLGADLKTLGLKESDPVLAIVDRADCEWSVQHFFLVEQEDRLVLNWFPQSPTSGNIRGKVKVVLRPPRKTELPDTDEGTWFLTE